MRRYSDVDAYFVSSADAERESFKYLIIVYVMIYIHTHYITLNLIVVYRSDI